MLETILLATLGISYLVVSHEENKQAAHNKKIKELKDKVFWYAVCKHTTYNSVLESLQKGDLTWDEIDCFLAKENVQ